MADRRDDPLARRFELYDGTARQPIKDRRRRAHDHLGIASRYLADRRRHRGAGFGSMPAIAEQRPKTDHIAPKVPPQHR